MAKAKVVKVPPLESPVTFEETFDGPFIVYIRRYIDLKNKNVKPVISVLSLAKVLSTTELLDNGRVTKISKDTCRIIFPTRREANQLLKERFLWHQGYFAFIPYYLLKQTGVLRGIPLDISEKDIRFELELQNYKVLDIYRMKKKCKNKIIDSMSVKVTLQCHSLPESVWIYNVRCDLYFYATSAIQCRNCYRFGHKAKSCRYRFKRCCKCGEASHKQNDLCQLKTPCCLHCKGNHLANDKNCPERQRQKEILQKVNTQYLTYSEAVKLTPKINLNVSKRQHSIFKETEEDQTKTGRKTSEIVKRKIKETKPEPVESKLCELLKHFLEKENTQIGDGDFSLPIIRNEHQVSDYEKLIQELLRISKDLISYVKKSQSQKLEAMPETVNLHSEAYFGKPTTRARNCEAINN